MATPVAVVTGSNKGIGFAIVKGLVERFPGIVYLTSRDPKLGEAAVAEIEGNKSLVRKCAALRYHQLDISDERSVAKLAQDLKQEHQGLDVLVNNAGMAYKSASTAPFEEQARESVKVNYFGTLQACRILFPLLRPHARVVNVSSRAGLLGQVKSGEIKARLLADDLTMEELSKIMQDFVGKAAEAKHEASGYSNSAYGMSKVGVTAMTRVLQREVDAQKPQKEDIVVTACCPGYVDTDMTSHKGRLTIEQGAETPLFLSFLPQGYTEGKGRFFAEKQLHEWDTTFKF